MSSSLSDPLSELQILLKGRSSQLEEWRRILPTLRAKSLASRVFLHELAVSPPQMSQTHDYVQLIIVPPEPGWAERVIEDLQEALSKAKITSEIYRGVIPPFASEDIFARRCEIRLGWWQSISREKVKNALNKISGVDVDYSNFLKLIVASPSED